MNSNWIGIGKYAIMASVRHEGEVQDCLRQEEGSAGTVGRWRLGREPEPGLNQAGEWKTRAFCRTKPTISKRVKPSPGQIKSQDVLSRPSWLFLRVSFMRGTNNLKCLSMSQLHINQRLF